MKMVLTRRPSANGWTLGQLSINGVHECHTCEDVMRDGPKVPGQTAIPLGTYKVAITDSPRFKRRLPLVLDVPGFEGIRIHPGNTAADTEGCILPGRGFIPTGVTQSVIAFDALFAKLEAAEAAGEEITLEIKVLYPRVPMR